MNTLKKPGQQLLDGHTLLLHGVSVTDGDGILKGDIALLAQCLKVYRNAEGGTYLVLATITAAYGSALIVEHIHEGAQLCLNLAGNSHLLCVLFKQREDGSLDGSHARVETHDGADVALAVLAELFLIIGLANNGQHGAVATGRRLYHVGDEFLARGFVKVLHRLAGALLVAAQVIIGTVGYPHELLHTEGELVLQVVGLLGVESALIFGYVQDMNLITCNTNIFVELEAKLQPLVGKGKAVFSAAEVFYLHLLELSRAEGEVARVNLVAEGFADLGNAEGDLHAGGIQHIFVLAEDALSGLGTQPTDGSGVVLIGCSTDGGLEHEVERASLCHQRTVGGIVTRAVSYGLGSFLYQLNICQGYILARYLAVVLLGTAAGCLGLFLAALEGQHRELLVAVP